MRDPRGDAGPAGWGAGAAHMDGMRRGKAIKSVRQGPGVKIEVYNHMANTRRTRRLGSLIRAELGDLLTRKVKDPRLAFISITGVDVSPDMGQAKVYFSLMDESKAAEAEAGFKAASGFLRGALAKKLNLKVIPRLVPVYDPSLVRGSEMTALINRVRAEDQAHLAEEQDGEEKE